MTARRYAVLADIHGNLAALDAALEAARRAQVSDYLVLGDLVGYGAHPNECVERVAALDALSVAGNHDLMAIGRLKDERCIDLGRACIKWTRRVLAPSTREFLEALPMTAVTGDGVVLAHGTLDDTEAYTATSAEAARQLVRLAETASDARVLLLGHTHRALAYSERRGLLGTASPLPLTASDRLVVNPGAVGQSREPRLRARMAIVDLDAKVTRWIRLGYDARGERAALIAAGLPAGAIHLRPGPRRVARVVIDRTLRTKARISGRAA